MKICRKLSFVLFVALCLSLFATAAFAEQWEEPYYEEKDSSVHKMFIVLYEGTKGLSAKPVSWNEPVEEAHTFADGKCVYCGYKKPADSKPADNKPADNKPTEEIKTADTTVITPVETPTTNGTTTGETTTGETTTGETTTGESTEESSSESESSSDSSSSATTTVAALSEVAESVEVYGVKVSDGLSMDNALTAVGNFIDNAKSDVKVPAVEEVMTSAQKTKFAALNAREKLQVAMAVLGFSEQVKANGNLSADANALIDEIMSSLSPAELKAISAAAMTKLTVNGTEYDAFILEFEVDGKKVRHTYINDNNVWTLAKIEQ